MIPAIPALDRLVAVAVYPALGAVLAVLSAQIVRRMIQAGAIDHPGVRSAHTRPTPKGGGVGIVCGFTAGLAIFWSLSGGEAGGADAPAWVGMWAAAALMAGVSYVDDARDLSFKIKLVTQIAAAGIGMACGLRWHALAIPGIADIQLGWMGIPITLAWIVFATNALNFIDGLNGLASGSVALACVVVCVVSSGNDRLLVAASFSLAASIAGFLPYNYPRARIFMGDVGSQFCGIVVALMGIRATASQVPGPALLLLPGLLFGILADVAFTLVRRAMAGEQLTKPHRGHLYQVAHRAGMPAFTVTLVYWGMVACSGAGYLVAARPWVLPQAWFWSAPVASPVGSLAVMLTLMVVPPLLWLAWVVRAARRHGVKPW